MMLSVTDLPLYEVAVINSMTNIECEWYDGHFDDE
jgi:hypothetical protein